MAMDGDVLVTPNLISFRRLCRSAIDHHRPSTDTGQCAIGMGGQFGVGGDRQHLRRNFRWRSSQAGERLLRLTDIAGAGHSGE